VGDAAEDAIDRGMEEDLYETGDWVYDGDFDICYQLGKASKSCRGCGVTGLVWRRFEKKWRLFDVNDKPHICTPDAKAAFK